MNSEHSARWKRLQVHAAAGGSAPSDPRVIATITQEMTEMDNDIGQMAAVLKNHHEVIQAGTTQQAELAARLQDVEQKLISGGAGAKASSSRSCTNQVSASLAQSDGFAAMRGGQPVSGRHTVNEGIKAILTNPDRGDSDATDYPTAPTRAPGIQGVSLAPLSLLDVLPIIPVESSTYEFVHLDGYISGAAYQAVEGDEKAEQELPTKLQRAEIATIAAWLPASKQVLDDNDQLAAQIGLLLSHGCNKKLEYELIRGAGGDGQIKGLIEQAMPAFSQLANPADRIGEGITTLKAYGWNPNVVVMNPADWFAIASERASAGNGQYVLGSPRDPSPMALWNTPVVVSIAMPQGQALVLDTSTIAVLDRQEVTVEASRHHGSNFTKNLITILAELRAGLAVYAPTANLIMSLEPSSEDFSS